MANQALNLIVVVNESNHILGQQLKGWGECTYEPGFSHAGAKVGCVVNVRKPHKFVPDLDLSASFVDTMIPVLIDTQVFVPLEIQSGDLMLSVDQFSKRILEGPCRSLAGNLKARWGLGASAIMVDLPLPNGTDTACRSVDSVNGYAVRLVRCYSPTTDTFPSRLDVLCGFYNQPQADAGFDARRVALAAAREKWARQLEKVRRRACAV